MTPGTAGQLAAARTAHDLVPGSPTRVLALAGQLEDLAAGLAATQRLLTDAFGTGWRGAAASAFEHVLASLPGPCARGAAVMGSAAAQVRSHAGVLTAAQSQAADALDLDRRATALTSTPGAPGGIVPPTAADAMHRRAAEEVEQARARVRASGLRAAEELRRAAAVAPERPNVLVRTLENSLRRNWGFLQGAAEAGTGTVNAMATISPLRALLDRRGWWRDVQSLGDASGQAAVHPRRTATALVDPTTLRQDPARWFGRLAPDLVIGYGTGGVGAVANRGVSIPLKLVTSVRRGEAGDDVRAAVRAARETSRSRLRARDLRAWSHRNDFDYPTELTPAQRMATAALARDATWAEHDVRSRVAGAAHDVGADLVGLDHAVKDQESLFRKVSEKSETQTIDQTLPTVNDAVRYTMVADPEEYVETVMGSIQALRSRGLLLVNPKTSWASHGYRGVNATWADPPTGRLVEVQVHTPASFAAGKATRYEYERLRQLGCPPLEAAQLSAIVGRAYAKVPTPPGVEHLPELLKSAGAVDATNRPPQLLTADLRPFVLRSSGSALVTAGAGPGSSLSSSDDRRAGRREQHRDPRQHGGGAP